MLPFFASRYGADKFSLAEVADMSQAGCYDAILPGVSGIAHVASPTSADQIGNFQHVIDGAVNILESAARHPEVRRVVYTSSTAAMAMPEPVPDIVVAQDAWNTKAVMKAEANVFENDWDRMVTMYYAEKTLAEKACFEWTKQNEPGFTLNSIVLGHVLGSVLNVEHQGYPTSIGMTKMLFEGDTSAVVGLPPQWFVDAQDAARVHVAALARPDVYNERLYTFEESQNYNTVLSVFRKLEPDRQFVRDIADAGRGVCKIPNKRTADLLKEFGQNGWTRLEDSLRMTIACILESERIADITQDQGFDAK